MSDHSEMVMSMRSGLKQSPLDGGVVGTRRQITDREINQYEMSDTEAGRVRHRTPAKTAGFDMVTEED